jgi:hypothetical protein
MRADLGLSFGSVQREIGLSRPVAVGVAAKLASRFRTPRGLRSCDACGVRFTNLTTEHPTLGATATRLVGLLGRWSAEVRPATGASSWTHHRDLAERTAQLASHLEATLVLAEDAWFPSAFVVARTALEHHLLDRLLLLADRYEEIVRPPDQELLDELEQAWSQKTEQWTPDVVSVERVRNRKALRLVRLGHKVCDDAGNVREQISPYWVAMEHYDAFLGHPDVQALTVRPFDTLDEREVWAKRNQALYGAFLRWGSICSNLELSQLALRAEIVQLQVHYAFLSAFAHATKSGYEVDRRPYPNSPPASHVLGEVVLLYVATIAVSELRSWAVYLDTRPHLLAPLSSTIIELRVAPPMSSATSGSSEDTPSRSTTARRPTVERTRSFWPVSPARSNLRSCSPTTSATTQTPSTASNACTPASER